MCVPCCADTSESGASSEIEEVNPHRLAQRQKQIDYGKNTTGYQSYVQRVPRSASYATCCRRLTCSKVGVAAETYIISSCAYLASCKTAVSFALFHE